MKVSYLFLSSSPFVGTIYKLSLCTWCLTFRFIMLADKCLFIHIKSQHCIQIEHDFYQFMCSYSIFTLLYTTRVIEDTVGVLLEIWISFSIFQQKTASPTTQPYDFTGARGMTVCTRKCHSGALSHKQCSTTLQLVASKRQTYIRPSGNPSGHFISLFPLTLGGQFFGKEDKDL